VQQSLSKAQPVRQLPFTHISPPEQSALMRQPGRGRGSAEQIPSAQRSRGPQSESARQTGWQWPLMQVPLPQSIDSTHRPPPSGSGWQNPPTHASPVPQSLSATQAGSHPPFRQRAPVPHSLLNRHNG
jgi:hypothetical protein